MIGFDPLTGTLERDRPADVVAGKFAFDPLSGAIRWALGITEEFSPLSLFASGEQGAWYDPSDYSTMFQDAAGTTPVTGVEQAVGLILDNRATGYSIALDGTGDALSAAGTTNFQFGTGDFTVELWVYITTLASGGAQYIAGTYDGSYGGFAVSLQSSCTQIQFRNGDAGIINRSYSFSANTWYHIAVTRSSSTLRFFVNGTKVGADEASYTQNITRNNTNGCAIGRYRLTDNTIGGYLFGNLSNLRVVKGTSVYTSDFTVPTSPLSAISGTVLLIGGVAWAGNPTISLFGDARTGGFSPFNTGIGNHASQTTLSARPVLRARFNLMTYTEQFSNAYWEAGRVAFSATTETSPIGTATADLVSETAVSGSHYLFPLTSGGPSVSLGVTYTAVYHLKKGNGATAPNVIQLAFALSQFGANAYANFSFATGDFTFTGSGISSAEKASLGSGWYRITLKASCAAAAATSAACGVVFCNNTPSASRLPSYLGVATANAYIWGADFRVANDGVGLPPYQRVAAATDYDTVGFPQYLAFDGADDALLTSAIDFTATDKMTVWAGVRRVLDSSPGGAASIVSLSTAANTNNGAFNLSGYNSFTTPKAAYTFGSRGTTFVSGLVSQSTYPAPRTDVLTVLYNISAPSIILRMNAAQAAQVTTSQGTGNYGNYPLYIASPGGSLNLNGHIYSLIIRGAQSTEQQITDTETWVNGKTKAYV